MAAKRLLLLYYHKCKNIMCIQMLTATYMESNTSKTANVIKYDIVYHHVTLMSVCC